jgi:hypothetical protein
MSSDWPPKAYAATDNSPVSILKKYWWVVAIAGVGYIVMRKKRK